MPPAGYEPAILAGEWLQTHALDRSATWIGIDPGTHRLAAQRLNHYATRSVLMLYKYKYKTNKINIRKLQHVFWRQTPNTCTSDHNSKYTEVNT